MKSIKRQLGVYLREEEYQAFLEAFGKSGYRSKTDYARRLVLGKPVKVLARNRSLDDLIELGVKLRKELRLLLTKDMFTPVEKESLIRNIVNIEEHLVKLVESCGRK
jgi:hypothetical protein